jgi:L-amino acid N-acyltransferase YncA
MIVGSKADEYGAVYVAAVNENDVVGFGNCGSQRSPELRTRGFNGKFESLYLKASARRRGLGRALMAEMARHLLCRNVRGASCWVWRENEPPADFTNLWMEL